MAHFTMSKLELAHRLQKVVGLEGKSLQSLDVSFHIGQEEIVRTTVRFVELIDGNQQRAITEVLEHTVENKEVA